MSQATFEPSSRPKYVLVNSFKGTALTLVEQDGVPAVTLDSLQYGDNQMVRQVLYLVNFTVFFC